MGDPVSIQPRHSRGGWEGGLPAAFASLTAPLPQMAAGALGKVGVLELRFERRDGRTRLVHQYATGPLQVGQAMYLDEVLDDMAFVFIQSVGGGILQGDRFLVDISVGSGARAHVTTQSAVKIYRMEADYAAQRVRAAVEGGGCLELINDPVIPYRGSRFFTSVEITAAENATVVYSDSLTPGRAASGESFAYELFYSRLVAHRPAGPPRAADTVVLEPARRRPERPGLLGRYTNLATLLILEDSVPGSAVASLMRDQLNTVADACGGASALPREDGALLRVLAGSSETAQAVVHAGLGRGQATPHGRRGAEDTPHQIWLRPRRRAPLTVARAVRPKKGPIHARRHPGARDGPPRGRQAQRSRT